MIGSCSALPRGFIGRDFGGASGVFTFSSIPILSSESCPRITTMERDAQREAMREPANPPKHFSMLRTFHLADFVTLANAACGMLSVFYSMLYVDGRAVVHFFIAAAMMPAAFIFDVLDGRIARWRHHHSALGRELESLADIVSFGVAPAALG